MRNLVLDPSDGKNQAVDTNVLKTTALLYFQEELFAQRYENCQELLAVAKSLGVGQPEINAVIKFHLRAIQTSGPNEANLTHNRLRFLEKEK